ncbi:MAG: metal-dependent transcriptional regulator [Phycisphaeraceae bacterium]
MHSSTTENYLKHLLLLQQQQDDESPVSTGKLATSLEVTPGTATVMVKGLAESGLVDYESRGGVRLTRSGQKAALDVLRRHRLVELFLVRVLGLDWSEVHEEAEILEHAVSEKVLQKIDLMLGKPAFDPHGDPIPDARGRLADRRLLSLPECKEGQRVEVSRVDDQSPQFLRFAEGRGLTPGASLTIEAVDEVADAVTLRGKGGEPLVIGFAAAKKILVSPLSDG